MTEREILASDGGITKETIFMGRADYQEDADGTKNMSEEQIEEAFAMFSLKTSEERAAASFESLSYIPASSIISVFEMKESES